MKKFFLNSLLQQEGWKSNVQITVDDAGIISKIQENIRDPQSDAIRIDGHGLPGFQNAHSHAFQYAMAGLAEVHDVGGNQPDDFWSWRSAMYRLALMIDPEQMEAIASMVYAEMLRHGYTHVAEFHYVHHNRDGQPYTHVAEMGERLVAAAQRTGMQITMIPICYQRGGFGKEPLDGQRRFITKGVEEYHQLLDATEKVCQSYDGANVGIGMHSLRGVEPDMVAQIAKQGRQDLPFHIHISEQLKEVADAIEYLGKRPVEWLLEHVDLTSRFHLVHATHLTDAEVRGIADNGAHVVLCPTTEGNLGDGLFPLRSYQQYGGRWSIGTDSHVSINPLEELRILDYGQRLITHKRDTFITSDNGDAAHCAIDMALQSGRRAMGNDTTAYFQVGQPFDAAIYDAHAPLLASASQKYRASTILYSSDTSHHIATISRGRLVVKDGRHQDDENISKAFVKTLKELGSRL